MRYEIIILVILAVSASAYAAEQQKIYFISMEYYRGSLNLIDVRLAEGFPSVSEENVQNMPNRAELISFDGKILYSGYFEIPNIIHVPPPIDESENTESVFFENVNFSISMPFVKNATRINIYGIENDIILSVDVSSFADYCGDSKCSISEDSRLCPSDCGFFGFGDDIMIYIGTAVFGLAIFLIFLHIKKLI